MGQTHCVPVVTRRSHVKKETCKKKTKKNAILRFLNTLFTSCVSSVNNDDHNGLSSAVKRADCTAPEILGTSTNTVGPEIAGPCKNDNTTIGLEMVGPCVCADEVGLNENSVTKEMAGPSKITSAWTKVTAMEGPSTDWTSPVRRDTDQIVVRFSEEK
ncbi:hypothetical protein SKAU_G00067030 [Synaphobranchus kaupii]|uniref:Uncharacterized protein n=1 Tax=Synaphobranchus kaupii TaxID=118154 RepID=A0A9Q1G6W8_SYNKA|nr:hypothetical protein SKAU_G00067030 [Synaphobranchus kaupii]